MESFIENRNQTQKHKNLTFRPKLYKIYYIKYNLSQGRVGVAK